VIRYKSAAEESEKAEEDLKQEKRKLLREVGSIYLFEVLIKKLLKFLIKNRIYLSFDGKFILYLLRYSFGIFD